MRSKQEFIREWNNWVATESEGKLPTQERTSRFSGTPALFAFRDMDYFALISPIGWTPAAYEIAEIIVPRGFVTDFASVPRLFWSMLPPIGRYGYAAIFHDFTYWQQTASRDEADKLFHDTMLELTVGTVTRNVLYYSVRCFGFLAWRNNAAAKASGEKRILCEFPTDLTTSWVEWKKRPDVFV